ncbi:thioesterase family protein [Nocardia sp. NPDC052278]|uniref:thioesterase family protein n=1 Tax=unclassified Nocardia TaxID=2637762 RepID=UPI0036B1D644
MARVDLLPTVAQVLALPHQAQDVVTPDFIDENGHMNIRHYLEFCSDCAETVVKDIGVDDTYRAVRRMGLFAAEHHLRYYSELHEGDTFSAHSRVLGRTDKAVQMLTFLLDRSHDRLASTVELVLVHVDLERRRSTAFPQDIAAGFDKYIAVSDATDWPAPTCGTMNVGR